jgi:ubiquinone/menaquinone biosynthesis C-methylase UbiE
MDMTEHERMRTWFFEIFNADLPRQGPGDDGCTLKALSMVPGIDRRTRALDIGCGTGPQTLVLAQHSPANIVAVDTHEPFIMALRRHAERLGISHRIDARVGDMRALDVPPGSFDLIWCEGAAYIMGFEAALRDWRKLLRAGGHMMVSEVCWTKSDPPRECAAFWEQEYPAIGEVPSLLKTIATCGYETVAHFTLPPSSWWRDFYRPLQISVAEFRQRHTGEADAQELADQVQHEIELWQAYSEFYSYAFFVMRI